MRRSLFLLFTAAFAVLYACSVSAICVDDMDYKINQILARDEYARSLWGVAIAKLDDAGKQKLLYSLNTNTFLVPASNNKIITSAGVLLRLPLDYQIKTSLYAIQSRDNPPPESQLSQMCLYGRGDPSTTLNGVQQAVNSAVSTLTQRGISTIQNMCVDFSFFSRPDFPSSWEYEDIESSYGGQPTSFVVNENVFTVRVRPGPTIGSKVEIDSFNPPIEQSLIDVHITALTLDPDSAEAKNARVAFRYEPGTSQLVISGGMPLGSAVKSFSPAVINPRIHHSRLLQTLFQQAGITVSAVSDSDCRCYAHSDNPNFEVEEIASIASPPLQKLTHHLLQVSDNLYTEMLLRHIGALTAQQSANPLQMTTEQWGIVAVQQALQQNLDVDVTTLFSQRDGSGVSRHNLATAQGFVKILAMLRNVTFADAYEKMLPHAGEPGSSLSNRFLNIPAGSSIAAKTGTVDHTASLSGYVFNNRSGSTPNDPDVDTIVFSIIANNSDKNSTTLRAGIDEIVMLLTEVDTNCNISDDVVIGAISAGGAMCLVLVVFIALWRWRKYKDASYTDLD